MLSKILVKTVDKDFPWLLLEGNGLEHGLFVAFSTETKDRIKLQACRFRDLKVKEFPSTCSTAIAGCTRRTKHHGLVSRPTVAEEYLSTFIITIILIVVV